MDMAGITGGGQGMDMSNYMCPGMKFSKTKQKTLLKQDISHERIDLKAGKSWSLRKGLGGPFRQSREGLAIWQVLQNTITVAT